MGQIKPVLLSVLMIGASLGSFPSGADQSVQVNFEKYYIGIKTKNPLFSAEAQCVKLRNQILLAARQRFDVTCSSGAYDKKFGTDAFRYSFEYERLAGGKISFKIINLRPDDDTDFEQASWTLDPGADETLEVQKLITRFFKFKNSKRLIKELALASGAASSEVIEIDKSGRYVEKKTGVVRSFEEAYSEFRDESPKNKAYLRAIIELAVELGAGTAWYYSVETGPNHEFYGGWEGFRLKYLNGAPGLRFDQNPMVLNTVAHPFAGTYYYLVARSDGLTSMESFMLGFAGSGLWESIVEFREVLSINDMIFTPVAGMAIGEAFYQLGTFFMHGSNNFANKILGAVIGGPTGLNHWLDKNRPHYTSMPDKYGFSTDVWHKFEIFGGAITSLPSDHPAGESFTGGEIGVHTNIVNIAEYGREGHVTKIISDTAMSEIIFSSAFGPKGADEVEFFAKAALAGYYTQSVDKGDNGDLRGYSFFIGPATAYEHEVYRVSGEFRPSGIINVLGPSLDAVFYVGGHTVHCKMDVFGDFAAIRSFAVDEYMDRYGLENSKELLENFQYYFAIGITNRNSLSVQNGPFEIGGNFNFDYFDSIEGRDHNRNLSNDVDVKDLRSEAGAWFSYTLPGDFAKLVFATRNFYRTGFVTGRPGQIRVDGVRNMLSGSVVFMF